MPELREIDLCAPTYSNSIDTPIGQVTLRYCDPKSLQTPSIKVELGTHEVELPRFATPKALDANGSQSAAVFALVIEEPKLILIGQFEAQTIEPDGVSNKLFDLFRSVDDERGFFKEPELIRVNGSLLMKYEGGIASLHSDGRLAWHLKCSWDDHIDRIAAPYLWFSNEHINGGKPWRISLEDGSRQ